MGAKCDERGRVPWRGAWGKTEQVRQSMVPALDSSVRVQLEPSFILELDPRLVGDLSDGQWTGAAGRIGDDPTCGVPIWWTRAAPVHP